MLLQKGDTIRLEKGMHIYASIPKKFITCSASLSNRLAEMDFCIGEIFNSKPPKKEMFVEELAKVIENHIQKDVPIENVSTLVDSLNLNFSPEYFDTSVFVGKYRVHEACFDEKPSLNSSSSNGWHVYCVKDDNPDIIVHFYQTGKFSAMIIDISPIKE